MRDAVPKQSEKLIAAKALEALGLLTLVKPLLKRAGSLTVAEQSVMAETIVKADFLLNECRSAYWAGLDEVATSKAVAKG